MEDQRAKTVPVWFFPARLESGLLSATDHTEAEKIILRRHSSRELVFA